MQIMRPATKVFVIAPRGPSGETEPGPLFQSERQITTVSICLNSGVVARYGVGKSGLYSNRCWDLGRHTWVPPPRLDSMAEREYGATISNQFTVHPFLHAL